MIELSTTIDPINIYVDPCMEDQNILIGRKAKVVEEPKLVFLPYVMQTKTPVVSSYTPGQKVEIIEDNTIIEEIPEPPVHISHREYNLETHDIFFVVSPTITKEQIQIFTEEFIKYATK